MKYRVISGISALIIVCIVVLIFSLGVVRVKCTDKGYDLSNLAKEIERKSIILDKLEEELFEYKHVDRLRSIAMKNGFIYMQGSKTYNVQ